MSKKLYPNWTVDEFVQSSRRLQHVSTGVWNCDAAPIGADEHWFCQQMFEQICVMNPELEKLFKTYKDGTERQKQRILKHLKEVCLRSYFQIVAQKFLKIAPQLVDYFESLYRTGEWEKDKKEYSSYPNGGIEPITVKKDRFIV